MAEVAELGGMAKRISSHLFISRLSSYTTIERLENLFSPFGAVSEASKPVTAARAARLVRDPETQRPKGFGFVTFQTAVEAEKALKAMNGRIVDGRLIFVEYAKTRRAGEDASS